MDRERKRKIKRLWQQRLLVTIGGVAALGFSVLQLQAVLRHRSPQPSWRLDLSEAVETISDSKGSDDKQEKALREIQAIAQKRELPVTAALALILELDWTLERLMVLKQVRVRDRVRDLDQSLNQSLCLVLALDKSRDWTRDWTQNLTEDWTRDLRLLKVLGLSPDRTLSLDRAREHYLAHDWVREQARNLAQDLDLDLDLDLGLELELSLERELNQELSNVDFSKIQALSQELVQKLEQAQTNLKISLIVLAVSTELEKEHQFALYQGNTLNTLVREEPDRIRDFLTSAILLTTSLLVLMALIIVLSKLYLSHGLASNSHLIAFLPEECAAELGVLKRRMEKKNVSAWHIRLRLLQEFLVLLWVFYIQVQINNLGLPTSDRSTDD